MCSACEDVLLQADEYVTAGIAWLDDHAPEGWRGLIDLNKLNINDPQDCVLGQVFRGHEHDTYRGYAGRLREYGTGYEYAVRELMNGQFDDSTTGVLGFSAVGSIFGNDMTEAWVRALS